MDLNELLHKHQIAVMKASASGDTEAQDGHFAKVAEYAARIRGLRDTLRASKPDETVNRPETIIYGSYAGDTEAPVSIEWVEPVDPVKSWEDEGGAVRHPAQPRPPQITERIARSYHVGPYVYQDLDLAVAEHLRQLSAEEGGTA
ncbi:hypothetical protein [Qipengyuania seohaensis]|uniref:hypothetical protein n=1 Tax=Qipengyuania seohaensis TaxID=266951 RepID=UPI000C22A576|nr:hypothetical protein [Qipengyuania seohaensis]